MQTVLISGANRGIGLALTGAMLSAGYRVIAGARNPDGARDLWELEQHYPGKLKILSLDVQDVNLATNLAAQLGADEVIDILVNNAGVLVEAETPFEKISLSAMTELLAINCVGLARVTQAALPFIKRSSQGIIAQISSQVGSIADNSFGGLYSYRMSKSAVNMLNKCLSLEYPNLICVSLHPGWVKTEMGGSLAPVEPIDSAKGLCQVIKGLKKKDTGRFLDFKGAELPW